MANVKITELAELAGRPDDADILEIVDDVAGSPTSKKITLANIRAAATDALIGSVLLATEAEAKTGTNASDAVTPATLRSAIAGATTITDTYDTLVTDSVIYCNKATPFTVTLIAAATAGANKRVTLLNIGAGLVTVEGNAAETLSGELNISLAQYEAVTLDCNGTNWLIVNAYNINALAASKPVFTDANKNLVSTGTLGVDQGGLGVATLALNGILYGNGASPVGVTAIGAEGDILVAGADPFVPAWSAGSGTGVPARVGSPVFTTQITTPAELIKGSTGGFFRTFVEATEDLSDDAGTATITLNIPTGVMILGVQLRVDTLIEGCTSWSAAFSGGNTAAICTEQAVAQNTKVNSFSGNITTNTTNILITAVGGGVDFTAGVLRAIVYYEIFTAMASL